MVMIPEKCITNEVSPMTDQPKNLTEFLDHGSVMENPGGAWQ